MKKMKWILLVTLLILGSITSCSTSKKDEKKEIIVFAAASMTETLTELGNAYMEENDGLKIIFNFDSSGTLKTQIEEGAACDIFISAGQKQMNELECVLEDTRFDILENKIALAVSENNKANIQSYEDLKNGLMNGNIMMAMGNADVPVGQYTQKILEHFALDEEELANMGVITYGSNVKEVTTQITEETVDCGIIYATDAFVAGLEVIDIATADMCGQVIYPAAVMNTSTNTEEAKLFLEYLTSEVADKIFEKVGFTPIE